MSVTAILTAISNITQQIGAVRKDGENEFHGYAYAKAADVMHKLQPLMAKEGLIIIPSEKSRELMVDAVLAITFEFTIAHKGGEVWPDKPAATGMAALLSTKKVPDDKAANKCMTAASKYFTLNLFKIPTGDYADPDADGDVPTRQVERPAPPGITERAGNSRSAPVAPEVRPAERAQPPVHPETGEISAHAIQRGVKDGVVTSWVEFGQAFVAAVDSSQTDAEVDAWVKANFKHLEDAKKNAPRFYDRLNDRTTARRRDIAEKPAQDARRAANAAPAANSGPTHEELIADFDEQLAKAATLEQLDGIWAQNESEIAAWKRATRDAAAQLFNDHVGRVKG